MKQWLISSVCLLACIALQAQEFPSQKFHRGQVTLTDGSVLSGQIKYDLNSEVILLKQNDKNGISTLNASQFQSFVISAGPNAGVRTFYSIPVLNETGYRRPRIFELIAQGKVSLIAREFIATRSRSANQSIYRRSIYDPYYSPATSLMTYQFLAYELWLIDENAELTELGNSRSDVIKAFDSHHSELRKYIKKEKLKVEKLLDLKRLVDYYNSLDTL